MLFLSYILNWHKQPQANDLRCSSIHRPPFLERWQQRKFSEEFSDNLIEERIMELCPGNRSLSFPRLEMRFSGQFEVPLFPWLTRQWNACSLSIAAGGVKSLQTLNHVKPLSNWWERRRTRDFRCSLSRTKIALGSEPKNYWKLQLGNYRKVSRSSRLKIKVWRY